MKKLFLALVFCIASTGAFAQCNGVFPSNTLCGNLDVSPHPPSVVNAGSIIGSTITYVTNHTINSSDCRATLRFGTGTTGLLTITIPSAGSVTSGCFLILSNGDSSSGGRGKLIVNDPGCTTYHILWMGQSCTIQAIGGAWTVIQPQGRFKPTAPITLQANGTSGSDSGSTDCLATGAGACATVAHAAKIICTDFDPNGQQLSVQLPTGSGITQNENIALCPYLATNTIPGTNNPQILGDPANPQNYAVVITSGVGIESVNVNTPWTLNGITIQNTGSGTCVEADINSLIYITGNTSIAGCTIGLLAIYTGKIEAIGPWQVNGHFPGAFVSTNNGGQFLSQNFTLTCNAGVTDGTWAVAIINSTQDWSQVIFSGCGSVVGTRYDSALGGGIHTNGGGSTFLPGNVSGTATSPGWYD